jgi:hypothetical protein
MKVLKLSLFLLHFNLKGINFIDLKNRENNFFSLPLHIKFYKINNKLKFSSLSSSIQLVEGTLKELGLI